AQKTLRAAAQHEADAAHRVQQALFAVGLGLAAEVPDVHVEQVRSPPEIEAPDAFEDLLVRQDALGVAQEQLQQRELRRRDVEEPVTATDAAPDDVELEVGEAHHVGLPL